MGGPHHGRPDEPLERPFRDRSVLQRGGDLDGSLETDGITFDVLRDVPLQEARRVISAYGPRLRQALGLAQAASHLPERVETDLDYARMAKRYVELVETGRRNPIGELAELAGVSRNTMSARIRRARDKGFLEGPEGKPATHLTSKAREVLSQVDPSGPPF